MAQYNDELHSEISTIIEAPYAVSLKKLQIILRDLGEDAPFALVQWSEHNGEKIPSLCGAVVDGLALWPYAPDILETLTKVEIIKTHLFQCYPSLLSHLLDECTSRSHDFNKVDEACINLLSEPLPKDVPLPASSQRFIWHVFDHAISEPHIETVEPLYMLLNGACEVLIETLSFEGLLKIRDHLTDIMRTIKGIDEQYLSLLCLGVISKLRKGKELDQPSLECIQGSERTRKRRSTLEEQLNKFFVGERALKTMHLLALQVIYACRADEHEETQFKHVRLACDVLEAVETDARKKWAEQNQNITRKLQEKILHPSLSSCTVLQALNCHIKLSDGKQPPSSLIKRFQTTILNTQSSSNHGGLMRSLISEMAPFFMHHLPIAFWTALLEQCISSVQNDSGAVKSHKLQLKHLLRSARQLLPDSTLMQNAVVDALTNDDLKGRLTCLLCGTTVLDAQLATEMCTFFLASDIYSEYGLSQSDTSSILAVLSYLQSHADVRGERMTDSKSSLETGNIRILGAKDPSGDKSTSVNWQGKLSHRMESANADLKESMVQLVGQICRGLEARCEEVEQPLRSEEEKTRELSDELNYIRQCLEESKDLLRKRDSQISLMQHEREGFNQEKEHISSEFDLLKGEHSKLQSEFERNRSDADRRMSETRRDFEARELDLRTTLACHVERLDRAAEEAESFDRKQNETEMLLERQKDEAEQDRISFRNSIKEMENKIETQKHLLEQNKQKLDEVHQTNEYYSTKVHELDSVIERNKIELANSRGQMVAERQTFENEISNLKQQHESQLNDMQINARSERQNLEAILNEEREDREREKRNLWTNCQSKDQVIAGLNRTKQQLTKECKQKNRQLAEAQQTRAKLLSALGLDDQIAEQKASVLEECLEASERSVGVENNNTTHDADGQAKTPQPFALGRRFSTESTIPRMNMNANYSSSAGPTTKSGKASRFRARQSIEKSTLAPLGSSDLNISPQKSLASRKDNRSGGSRGSSSLSFGVPSPDFASDQENLFSQQLVRDHFDKFNEEDMEETTVEL